MAILVIGWMLWVATPDTRSVAQRENETQDIIEEKEVSFVGKTVCLPVRNEDEPHNDLCAFGLLLESGEYYALDTEVMENGLPEDFNGDTDVRITGILTAPESNEYDVVGLIRATHIEPAVMEEEAQEDEVINEEVAETEPASEEDEEVVSDEE